MLCIFHKCLFSIDVCICVSVRVCVRVRLFHLGKLHTSTAISVSQCHNGLVSSMQADFANHKDSIKGLQERCEQLEGQVSFPLTTCFIITLSNV